MHIATGSVVQQMATEWLSPLGDDSSRDCQRS